MRRDERACHVWGAGHPGTRLAGGCAERAWRSWSLEIRYRNKVLSFRILGMVDSRHLGMI